MGRLTQYFDFINRQPVPSEYECRFKYSHLAITNEIKKCRTRILGKKKTEGQYKLDMEV